MIKPKVGGKAAFRTAIAGDARIACICHPALSPHKIQSLIRTGAKWNGSSRVPTLVPFGAG
jgi:hypothetical protein